MEEVSPNDIVVMSDGGNYELLRLHCDDYMHADEVLVQVCSACGFEPCIMVLKDGNGEILEKTINACSIVYLWSCKGANVPQKTSFTISIGYKTLFTECTMYAGEDPTDLNIILERGCNMYRLDPNMHEVQAFNSYYMIFEKKRQRLETPQLPPMLPPPLPRESVEYVQIPEAKGTVKVILPDGSAKTVLAKTTTRVGTVLHAICSKMDWRAAEYTIDADQEAFVQFDCVYEIKRC